MKRKIVFAAMAALLLSVLACERQSGGSGGSSRSNAPTLIWWQIGTTTPDLQESLRTISDYTEEKIGVRLDIRQAGWGDAVTRFTTMINAGEYYDILFTDGGTYSHFVNLGAFADLTDLLPTVTPRLYDFVPRTLWEGVKIRNRIYSVPTYKDSAATFFIFWDERFVQKYDIDLTQTSYSYLDQVFRRMKAGEGQRFYPYVMARGTNTFVFKSFDGISAGLDPIGVDLSDQNHRVVNTLEDPRVLEILRYLHSWNQAGIINPDANMADNEARGKPFMIAQAWPSVAIPYAQQEGVERYIPVKFFGPIYSTDSIRGSMNAISVKSRHTEEALKLLELVNTDTKLRDMLTWGIEGRHFEYVDGGRAVRKLRDWALVNYQIGTFFIGTPEDTVPPGYWEEVRQLNNSATPSVMLGFTLDLEPIQNEIINARSIWGRYRTDLVTGTSDPDVIIPQIMTELRNANFDRIITEAQRQVDAFFANK